MDINVPLTLYSIGIFLWVFLVIVGVDHLYRRPTRTESVDWLADGAEWTPANRPWFRQF